MNKTIFDCYNNFIARVVIGSCGRASRYQSKRENCGDFGTSSQTRTQNETLLPKMFLFLLYTFSSTATLHNLPSTAGHKYHNNEPVTVALWCSFASILISNKLTVRFTYGVP